jgi:hypothetical protein
MIINYALLHIIFVLQLSFNGRTCGLAFPILVAPSIETVTTRDILFGRFAAGLGTVNLYSSFSKLNNLN